MASSHQSLLLLSLVCFILMREMQVEVAVHLVWRNHSIAESTFRSAALRCLQLCPHSSCITQIRYPDRLQSRMNQRGKKCIIYALNCPYSHSTQPTTKVGWTTWPQNCGICCFKEHMSPVNPIVRTNIRQKSKGKMLFSSV